MKTTGLFICKIALLASAFNLAFASAATAQTRPDMSGQDEWIVHLGGGFAITPQYEGDDSYRLNLLPYAEVRYGEKFQLSVPTGAKYTAKIGENLSINANARLAFARDEDGSSPFAISGSDTIDLRGLGEVDASLELGGGLEYDWGNLSAFGNLRQAVTGHDGLIGDIGLSYGGRLGTRTQPHFWRISPSLKLANDNFVSSYFGITPAQSAASNLPVFDAGGGIYAASLSSSYIMTTSRRTSVIFQGSVSQLMGDAKDAPLVSQRGSATQVFLGTFFTYQFGGR